ncbi:MAG: hypothetical protein ACPGYY_03145 [Bacteroidia bacterium]
MKKSISFKILLLTLSSIVVVSSCQKENIDETITVIKDQDTAPRILGDWEAFKVEKHELVLDSLAGSPPKAFHSMIWKDQTSVRTSDSKIKFNNDNTFQDFYAEVEVFDGTWDQLNDSTYTMTFDSNGSGEWSDINTDYLIKVHCDNSISVQHLIAPPAGTHEYQDSNWQVITYFRTLGSMECDELIDFKVE